MSYLCLFLILFCLVTSLGPQSWLQFCFDMTSLKKTACIFSCHMLLHLQLAFVFFAHATQPAKRLKCYGHLHYHYITYSRQQQDKYRESCISFSYADHITFLTWFTFIPGLSFTLLHKWTSELQSCFSVLILWSHYKECTSLVAPVFIQLITWIWHSEFINLCFSASHANALSFLTYLTLKNITFYS